MTVIPDFLIIMISLYSYRILGYEGIGDIEDFMYLAGDINFKYFEEPIQSSKIVVLTISIVIMLLPLLLACLLCYRIS